VINYHRWLDGLTAILLAALMQVPQLVTIRLLQLFL